MRNILAVLAGLIAGSALNMAIITLSSSIFPPPADMGGSDPEALATYFDSLPASAFLLAMVAHLGQAGVGGWLAARLGGSRPVLLALIVGGFTLLGGVASLLMIPHPSWMWVELPLYLLLPWLAGRQVARSRARA